MTHPGIIANKILELQLLNVIVKLLSEVSLKLETETTRNTLKSAINVLFFWRSGLSPGLSHATGPGLAGGFDRFMLIKIFNPNWTAAVTGI